MGIERLSVDPPGERPPLSYLVARGAGADTRRVILVHGTPGSAGAWSAVLKGPPDGTEVIAVDRPGFGRSGPRRAVVSFQEQAAALEPLLLDHDGRGAILVGHSLGGPIVARAAADYPERVAGIVLLAASLDPRFENVGLAQGLVTTPLVRAFLPRVLSNSLVELRAGREQTEALARVLPRVRCPVIIIHGRKDGLVPYANVEYTRRNLANAASVEVVTIDDGDHFLPWNRAEVIREAIQRLDALADGTGR